MEHSRHAPKSNSYTISIPMQVKAVMARRVQIIRGDLTAQVVQLLYEHFTTITITHLSYSTDQCSDLPSRCHGNNFLSIARRNIRLFSSGSYLVFVSLLRDRSRVFFDIIQYTCIWRNILHDRDSHSIRAAPYRAETPQSGDVLPLHRGSCSHRGGHTDHVRCPRCLFYHYIFPGWP